MAKNNIVLYQPEIPQNTGNVMRTCAGTDTTLHLIKPLGFSLDEKNIKRSAANYVPNVNYIVYENWKEFLEKNPGGKKYYLSRYGKKTPHQLELSNPDETYYFVIGKESSGIPKSILRDNLENCIRLPMNDKIRALNMSNVCAICVYEALRQQDYNDLLTEEPDCFKGSDWLLTDDE